MLPATSSTLLQPCILPLLGRAHVFSQMKSTWFGFMIIERLSEGRAAARRRIPAVKDYAMRRDEEEKDASIKSYTAAVRHQVCPPVCKGM